MRNYYQFTLHVECPDGARHTHAFRVNANNAPQFERYDMCTDPLSAMMDGGVMSMAAAQIDTDRRRLAEQISAALTHSILESIKARDLVNGYDQPQKNSCEQTL